MLLQALSAGDVGPAHSSANALSACTQSTFVEVARMPNSIASMIYDSFLRLYLSMNAMLMLVQPDDDLLKDDLTGKDDPFAYLYQVPPGTSASLMHTVYESLLRCFNCSTSMLCSGAGNHFEILLYLLAQMRTFCVCSMPFNACCMSGLL